MGTGSQRLLCPTLVARDDELAVLAESLARAAAGHGETVIVGGDAGIGKSALVRRFAENARAAASRVLTGDCTEVEARRPLGPFLDAIEQARRAGLIRPDDADRLAPLLSNQFEEAFQPRLHQAIMRLLTGISRGSPLLLLIEDLHWADDASLDLFRYVARRAKDERLVLIGTYRTDELHRRHPLRPVLAELVAARVARGIELAALDRSATGRVLRETLRLTGEAPAALLNAVHERCEGNPFFIEETLESMRARGVLHHRGGEWIGADSPLLSLPDSIRDAVERRLTLLSEDARRVLRIAAVIGQRFDFDLLSLVGEVPPQQLAELLRPSIDTQLVVELDAAGRFAFRHALTRESVIADLLEPERRVWHRAIAVALEARPNADAHVEDLAYHFDAAGEGSRAFAYHLRAADHARSLAAFARAVEHLERAIALADPNQDMLALYARLAEAVAWIDFERGERSWRDVYERAVAAGRLFEAGTAMGRVGAHHVYRSMPGALSSLTRAIELLSPFGDTRELAHAYDLLGQWHMYSGERAEGIAAATRALEIAERIGARHRAIGARVNISLMKDDPDQQAMTLRSAIDETREIQADDRVRVSGLDPTGPLSRYYRELAVIHANTLSPERDALLEEWQHWAESMNFADDGLESMLAYRALGRGDFDGFLRRVGPLLETPSMSVLEQVHAALVRVSRGGPEAGAIAIRAVRDMNLRPGAANAVKREIAQILLLQGDLVAIVADPGAGRQWDNPRIGKAVITALYAARAARHMTASAEWYARADELRERGDVARFAAIYADAERAADRGDLDSAAGLLETVADAMERFDSPAIATQLRLRRADVLRARDRRAANIQLAGVAAFWRRAKATWYLGQLEAWTREHDLDWPGDPELQAVQTANKSLTERESDVARLVALGLTNREIADRLVISERTAEGHVQRILDKLGFRSRSQIAAWHASSRAIAATRVN